MSTVAILTSACGRIQYLHSSFELLETDIFSYDDANTSTKLPREDVNVQKLSDSMKRGTKWINVCEGLEKESHKER